MGEVYKVETIPEEIAELPPFEPEVISKEIGPVKPEAPPIVMPYLAVLFMDVTPKKVHDVKVSWHILPWETALKGTLDVEVSCVLPSLAGGILNNSDLGGRKVLRDASKSFGSMPLESVTIEFPWRVKGLDIARAIWAFLTGGRVPAKIWGTLSEFIFAKDFNVSANVPVR